MALAQTDLFLVGLGMADLRQMTLEAVEVLRSVKAIYHFSDRHEALCAYGKPVYDVREMYERSCGSGRDVYRAVAEFLVERATDERPIAVAFEGNPMFFCTVSWIVSSLGLQAGLRVEAVVGVSCLDVLPVQLGFDPGDLGMQVMEATALVRYGLAMNPHLSTLLLQVGQFGTAPWLTPTQRPKGTFQPMIDHLLRYYSSDHPAVFHESTTRVAGSAATLITEIAKIDEIGDRIGPAMALYLPRTHMPKVVHPEIRQGEE